MDSNLKRRLQKYGLSLGKFKLLEIRSGGVCEVCGKPPGSRSLHIDHQHVRGWAKLPDSERGLYVRGLLCWRCNTGLRKWLDNPGLLEAAALYLRRFETLRGAA